jgi:hypothetical protein
MLTSTRPLRIAVLCSGRAPGLMYLLNRDPRRGTEYDVMGCVSSQHTFAEQVRMERRGVPCLPHSLAQFCHERGARPGDMALRVEYELATLATERPGAPLNPARSGRWALAPGGSFSPDAAMLEPVR